MATTTAKLNRHNQSPRKTRLLTELIKGKGVPQALDILSLSSKRGAEPILKLLRSAMASTKNILKVDPNSLYVKDVSVDGGVVIKRTRPRAFGRAHRIRKRTSNVKLVLEARKS